MKIDVKYKIPLQGEYWAGINTCPECMYQPEPTATHHIIGFADSGNELMAIVECPKCFTKWYFHARDIEGGTYYYFKEFIKEGTQKHFNLTKH